MSSGSEGMPECFPCQKGFSRRGATHHLSGGVEDPLHRHSYRFCFPFLSDDRVGKLGVYRS